ncbi:hypothetical protein [Nocardia sp. NBC_01388]|uniref:hypothetical protein n=1 Tax=Nocardia sp. NBC_01388 TaxID=2903596 RepID=UPI00324A7A73
MADDVVDRVDQAVDRSVGVLVPEDNRSIPTQIPQFDVVGGTYLQILTDSGEQSILRLQK